MAIITTYTSLLTAVGDYLKRSNLSTFAPNFVQNWEEDFYREPRNFGRWMETSGTIGTIASSVVAVPAAYLGLKVAYINGSPSTRLDRKSLTQMYGKFPRGGDTGLPIWIARDGANFIFGPEPDSTYTVKGTYWAKQTLLRSFTGDAAAHWIIVNAPDLALYGSLLAAEPFSKNDARIPVWQAMYDRALDSYRRLHMEEDDSGSPFEEVLA